MEKTINDDCGIIIEIVGVDNFRELLKTIGGSNVYFPKLASFDRQKRDETIIKEFNGGNFRELAKKHDLSESHVRSILNKSR